MDVIIYVATVHWIIRMCFQGHQFESKVMIGNPYVVQVSMPCKKISAYGTIAPNNLLAKNMLPKYAIKWGAVWRKNPLI